MVVLPVASAQYVLLPAPAGPAEPEAEPRWVRYCAVASAMKIPWLVVKVTDAPPSMVEVVGVIVTVPTPVFWI